MKTQSINERVAALPFFKGMSKQHLDFISGCASHVHFKEGAFLLLEGKEAEQFFAIWEGRVCLEIEAANKTFIFQTIGEGDVVGWSWLTAPYRWAYDARAVTSVSAIGFDAPCVRRKCEEDPVFGYEMLKRFSQLIIKRLMATRMLLTDMYQ